MTPEQASFLLHEVYLPQVRKESQTTRRVIAAIPADNSAWKPDPKSKSALELAWHIASSECFFMNGVIDGKYAPGGGKMPDSIKTPEDVVNWYDEHFPKTVARLAEVNGQNLVEEIDFFGIFKHRGIVYIQLMSNHSIHHRGQLSSYLRPMGSKVPGIYGPSGDEPLPVPAQATA